MAQVQANPVQENTDVTNYVDASLGEYLTGEPCFALVEHFPLSLVDLEKEQVLVRRSSKGTDDFLMASGLSGTHTGRSAAAIIAATMANK